MLKIGVIDFYPQSNFDHFVSRNGIQRRSSILNWAYQVVLHVPNVIL